jgi:hypothetical protein
LGSIVLSAEGSPALSIEKDCFLTKHALYDPAEAVMLDGRETLVSSAAPGVSHWVKQTMVGPYLMDSSRAWMLTQIAIQKLSLKQGKTDTTQASGESEFRRWTARLFDADDKTAAAELAKELGL